MVTVAHTLHSFTSRKQAAHILAILGRIGDIGGKDSLEITDTDVKVAGRTVCELRLDVEAWAKSHAKVGREVTTRLLSDSAYVAQKVAELRGMVRGLVYSQGGTR